MGEENTCEFIVKVEVRGPGQIAYKKCGERATHKAETGGGRYIMYTCAQHALVLEREGIKVWRL